jgi:hypothetical protein
MQTSSRFVAPSARETDGKKSHGGTMNRATLLTTVAFATMCAGCDGSPAGPAYGAILTFSVGDERFRVALTVNEQIAAAHAAQAGGAARVSLSAELFRARRPTRVGVGISRMSPSRRARSNFAMAVRRTWNDRGPVSAAHATARGLRR